MAACLSKVNQMLIPVSEISTFVTVFYGILDLKTGELSYCNGGHNLPVLLSSDGSATELEDVGGLLMGKFSFAQYEKKSITLNPGDTIITFTDGVTEAENEDDEQLEEERLLNYLEGKSDKSVTNNVKGVFLEVLKFVSSAPQSDDITVLGVKYKS